MSEGALVFINISYDSSVGGAPAGFVATVNSVASFLDNLFTSSVTVNINVGFGEFAGFSLDGALGASYVLLGPFVSYARISRATWPVRSIAHWPMRWTGGRRLSRNSAT